MTFRKLLNYGAPEGVKLDTGAKSFPWKDHSLSRAVTCTIVGNPVHREVDAPDLVERGGKCGDRPLLISLSCSAFPVRGDPT